MRELHRSSLPEAERGDNDKSDLAKAEKRSTPRQTSTAHMSGNVIKVHLVAKSSQLAQIHPPKLKDRAQSKERVKKTAMVCGCVPGLSRPGIRWRRRNSKTFLLQFFFWCDGSE